MIRYTREEINKIREKNIKITLSDNVLKMITSIVEEVGCPTYIKTPAFVNKRRNFERKKIERPNRTPPNMLQEIQSILNRISDKNYDKLKYELLEIIKNSKSSNIITFEDVVKKIYESVCIVNYNIPLYAKLFSDLTNIHDDFSSLCLKEYNVYISKFNNIKCVSPDEDYDEFCKVNALNQQIRSISKFYTELVFYNILNINQIVELIKLLQEKLIITGKEHTPDVNPCMEYAENLYILIIGTLADLKRHSEWNDIFEKINYIRSIDKKENKNITSKIVFKHMDILDLIKKNGD
tara:strand:+ start:256 stop:1137 length:882 start_codon:yes stop_codon:yes gene_type:complete